jgi:hypothetical protein
MRSENHRFNSVQRQMSACTPRRPIRFRVFFLSAILPIVLALVCVTNTAHAQLHRIPIETLTRASVGSTLHYDLPTVGRVPFNVVKKETHPTGVLSVLVRRLATFLDDATERDYIMFTIGQESAYATAYIDGEMFNMRPISGVERNLVQFASDSETAELPKFGRSLSDDVVMPTDPVTGDPISIGRRIATTSSPNPESQGGDRSKAGTSVQAVVDVLYVYSPEYASGFSSQAALDAQIQSFIDYANVAYTNSNIKITLRRVGAAWTTPIAYPATSDNLPALVDMQAGNGAFSGLKALRDQYGADIVVFIRPYLFSYTSAGIANLTGYGYTNESERAFALTTSSASSPNPWLHSHEVGHVFGAMHSRVNANPPSGPFEEFGYGFNVAGSFATILSYAVPKVPFYSNPDVARCGPASQACGTPTDNNARVLNETRCRIGNYRRTTDSSFATGTVSMVSKSIEGTYYEGDARTLTVTARRSGGSCGNARAYVDLRLGVSDCPSGAACSNPGATDFTLSATGRLQAVNVGYVEWADGDDTDKTFSISILNDTIPEDGVERLWVGLYGSDYASPTNLMAIRIVDDDRLVNGECGFFAAGPQVVHSMQPKDDINRPLCSQGAPSAVSGVGPWSWTCRGFAGGTTASCSGQTIGIGSCTIGTIGSTTPISGAIGAGCLAAQSPNNNAKYYAFTLAKPSDVKIDLTSTFDNQLFLNSGATLYGDGIAANDDSDGKNARIISKNLAPGDYTIVAATGPGANPGGTFTLALKVVSSDPNSDDDADGIPYAAETGEGRDPFTKDNAIFAGQHPNSNRWFAMQQYRDFLAREGESAGISSWTTLLANNAQSRAQVTRGFFDSQEFQGAYAPLVRLYLTYFNRVPDYGGLTGWVGASTSGASLASISQSFASSPEFTLTYGPISNAQFVTLCYQNVLSRAPDTAGFNHWLNQLSSGALTRGQVMLGFSESDEFKALSYNRVAATMAYVGLLRRSPESGGFASWLSGLNAGGSVTDMLGGFINSQEYRNRFLP